MKGNKDARDDWETNLGGFTLSYFESFVSVLERKKFAEDELLREGFAEAVEKGIVRFRVVDKLPSGYNEIVLDDGAVAIQVYPFLSWSAWLYGAVADHIYLDYTCELGDEHLPRSREVGRHSVKLCIAPSKQSRSWRMVE